MLQGASRRRRGLFSFFPLGGGLHGGLEWKWQLAFICIATEIHSITTIQAVTFDMHLVSGYYHLFFVGNDTLMPVGNYRSAVELNFEWKTLLIPSGETNLAPKNTQMENIRHSDQAQQTKTPQKNPYET